MRKTIIERTPPTIEDQEDEIEEAIYEFNHKQPGYVEPRSFKYRLHDDAGKLIGGLDFEIKNEWLFIDELAVEPTLRGKGYGRQMIKEVEEFAISKGCTKSNIASFNYQAPEFYIKCGYEITYVRESIDKRRNYNKLFKRLK